MLRYVAHNVTAEEVVVVMLTRIAVHFHMTTT